MTKTMLPVHSINIDIQFKYRHSLSNSNSKREGHSSVNNIYYPVKTVQKFKIIWQQYIILKYKTNRLNIPKKKNLETEPKKWYLLEERNYDEIIKFSNNCE